MTRRHALIGLLLCAVAWILFSTLIAPGIVQHAYHGRSYDIFNRLISGRSQHPVEFYLRRWSMVSWMTLGVTISILLPVLLFRPRQLLKAWTTYWFRSVPVIYLSFLRVVAVGAQLIMLLMEGGYGLRQLAGLASLPDSMFKPLPALQMFLLPFGSDARPSFALVTVIYWITAAVGVAALVGWMSRISLLLFAIGNTFLQAFAYSFGDLHHREALMIITLWLLAFSPAGGALSFDSYFGNRNSSRLKKFRERSIFAAWPLILVQHLFGLVYLDAALRKLYAGGVEWVNGYTLQYYLYSDASRRGSAFGLWLARQHTAACIFSWVTILWEGTFFLVLIFPRLVWIYLPLGIGLHTGMALAGVASFPQFLALYVVFVPVLWNHGGRSVAAKLGLLRRSLATQTPVPNRPVEQPVI